jgi:hypothetical protein
LGVLQPTVWKILQEQLAMVRDMVQMANTITEYDKVSKLIVSGEFLHWMEEDEVLLSHAVFSDEAISHILGYVNLHNVKIQEMQNPHASVHIGKSLPNKT